MHAGNQIDGNDAVSQHLTRRVRSSRLTGMFLCTVLALGVLLSGGCSSRHGEHEGHEASTLHDVRVGPAYSECGSLTTPDVAAVLHRADLKLVAKTPAGCTWTPNGYWSAPERHPVLVSRQPDRAGAGGGRADARRGQGLFRGR
ncbi:Uncharacterised protein [Mycobacteroides abscessus subsp. massiliense]|nr:Uncharacterised protein [Mycobacteroides abscessus subsp. massiliense]